MFGITHEPYISQAHMTKKYPPICDYVLFGDGMAAWPIVYSRMPITE